MPRHVRPDNLIIANLHCTAWRYAANLGSIEEAIGELTELSGGRLDLLAQAGGMEAGLWYAKPSNDAIRLLIAGLLISVNGNIDAGELTRWSRVGYERAGRGHHGTHDYPEPSHIRERLQLQQDGQQGQR